MKAVSCYLVHSFKIFYNVLKPQGVETLNLLVQTLLYCVNFSDYALCFLSSSHHIELEGLMH